MSDKLSAPALSPEDVALMLGQAEQKLLGDQTNFNFGLSDRDGSLIFKGSNSTNAEIAAAARRIGADIKKSGSPELKIALGLDANKDATISKAEVKAISDMELGARAIAANMEYFREYAEDNYAVPTTVTAKFRNDFEPSVIQDLKDPEFAALTTFVADQIVKDNSPGHASGTPEEIKQLAVLAKAAKNCGRCL